MNLLILFCFSKYRLVYPLEFLWSIIKSRIKRREPSSIEELKKYLIEEWNLIPINLIQNLCKNYLYSINKVFELSGSKLEPENLKNKDLKNMSYERALSIINALVNLEEEINKKINKISKMNLMEYVKYLD